jgi:hypothetical protein
MVAGLSCQGFGPCKFPLSFTRPLTKETSLDVSPDLNRLVHP